MVTKSIFASFLLERGLPLNILRGGAALSGDRLNPLISIKTISPDPSQSKSRVDHHFIGLWEKGHRPSKYTEMP